MRRPRCVATLSFADRPRQEMSVPFATVMPRAIGTGASSTAERPPPWPARGRSRLHRDLICDQASPRATAKPASTGRAQAPFMISMPRPVKGVGRSDGPALTLAEWSVRGGNAAYVTVAALTPSSIRHHTHPLSSPVRTCSSRVSSQPSGRTTSRRWTRWRPRSLGSAGGSPAVSRAAPGELRRQEGQRTRRTPEHGSPLLKTHSDEHRQDPGDSRGACPASSRSGRLLQRTDRPPAHRACRSHRMRCVQPPRPPMPFRRDHRRRLTRAPLNAQDPSC
jgi:hypothetical protein